MTKLKTQQAGFTVDAEIKPKVFMWFVVKLGAFSNPWNPVFQKLHIGIRT